MCSRRLAASLLMAVALLFGPLAIAGAPARAQQQPSVFSPQQRAEIVGILRTALKTDPSILRDAIDALQQDERRTQQAAARLAIGRALRRCPTPTGTRWRATPRAT